MQDMIDNTKQKIEKFNNAIKYLEQCGEFDFDDFKEAHRIAGTNAQESELSEMWSDAKFVLPGPDHSGGVESLREVTQDSFQVALREVKKLLEMMEKI